ncbi:MAG: MotA/TolQ/ExbB proton channel family protein [Planctomycetaceae bacterium]|nr:MotA/TolQ/ExbB proton channel family protein [Planctomycetaceae bacterium]
MLEQLSQFQEQIRDILPPWDEVLILLSDHFVDIILAVALLEAFLALIVFAYNRRYLRKVDRWFRYNVLHECSKPSYLLSRWLQVEHLLHTFRVEYVKKLDDKNQESLKEEYHKLTNEKTHSIYAYSKWARTCFNLFFDLIPMFPMLGILGTVVAIACQFSAAQEMTDGAETILRSVTQNFGMAIWTTIYGIGFAIGFTIINATFIESGTQKCFELEKTARQSLDDVLHLITTRQQQSLPRRKTDRTVTEQKAPSSTEKPGRRKRRRDSGGSP